MKEKKHKEDELHSNKKQDKELLLWLVKIFHADPVFAFHVSRFFTDSVLGIDKTLQKIVVGQLTLR